MAFTFIFGPECQHQTIKHLQGECMEIFSNFTSSDDEITIDSEPKTPIKMWIAGGFIRDLMMGVRPRDVDIFFPTKEDADLAMERLAGNFDSPYENKNSVSYDINYGKKTIRADLVHGLLFKDPEETINSFDFTVACGYAAWDGKSGVTVGLLETMLLDLPSRSLRINALPMPEATMRRVAKYVKKGFIPCQGTMYDIYKKIRPEAEKTEDEEPNTNASDYAFWKSVD